MNGSFWTEPVQEILIDFAQRCVLKGNLHRPGTEILPSHLWQRCYMNDWGLLRQCAQLKVLEKLFCKRQFCASLACRPQAHLNRIPAETVTPLASTTMKEHRMTVLSGQQCHRLHCGIVILYRACCRPGAVALGKLLPGHPAGHTSFLPQTAWPH